MFNLTPMIDSLIRTASPFARLDAAPAMDVYRRGAEVLVQVDLPGVSLNDVSLEVADGWITITAERPYSPEPTDSVYLTERPFGRFERRLRLGSHIDPASVQAELTNGVLTVRLNSSTEQTKTKVQILAGPIGEK